MSDLIYNRMRRIADDAAKDDTIRECFLDGKFTHYDAMSSRVTGDPKSIFKNMTHIGSSKIYRINGVVTETDEPAYFYVRTDRVFAPYTEVPKRNQA